MRRGAAERFTVPFEGRGVHFCRQNAAQRLSHRQRACAMMPRLGKRGLGGEEAYETYLKSMCISDSGFEKVSSVGVLYR